MNIFILLAIALILSSIGFLKFVYFLSTGYAFAVFGLSVALALSYRQSLGLGVGICVGILALYSARLGLFLALREKRSGAYKKVLDDQVSGYKKIPLFVSIAIWLSVSCLYVAQVSPLYFRLKNGQATAGPVWLWIGAAVMALGLTIQALADAQKSLAKSRKSDTFVATGLFRLVRCPSYLGEILVWTGLVLSSACCLGGWFQVSFAAFGYLGIVYVMFGSARRLELRQNARYGADPQYQSYVRETPVLIPFIPLRSLAGWKWLVI